MIGRSVILIANILMVANVPVQASDIREVVSKKGIVAWFVQDKSVPLIALDFVFRGAGSATDPDGKEGAGDMVSSLLNEGAGDISSADFQRELEEIAARMSFSAGRDHFSGRMTTLASEKDTAFRLLKLALNSPRFDEKPMERIRSQMLASLRRQAENPRRISGRIWNRTVFEGHPYSKPGSGTEETVPRISRTDLTSFVRERFTRNRLIIGVVGDIGEAELARRLDEVFGRLPKTGPEFDIPEIVPGGAGRTVMVKKPIPQSVVVLGQKGIKRADPDWYAALLVTWIFGGGGFSSRLYEEVREKRGLAYSVYAYLSPMERSAIIFGGVATQNARAAESIGVIRAEWRKLSEKGITKKELKDAKTYMNGSFPLRLGSSRGIANLLVGVQVSKLGINYIKQRSSLINGVTLAHANRVAHRLYNADDLTVVVVGDPDGVVSSP